MSRKKENMRNTPSYIGEVSPFAVRLKEEMDKHGMKQQQVADYLGVKRQTVSLYTKGKAVPDINTLAKISSLFNISTDYLLGLSEAKSMDDDIQELCRRAKISEEAVTTLSAFCEQFPSQIVNKLIYSGEFHSMLNGLHFIETCGKVIKDRCSVDDISKKDLECNLTPSNVEDLADMAIYNSERKLLQDRAKDIRAAKFNLYNVFTRIVNAFGNNEDLDIKSIKSINDGTMQVVQRFDNDE